MHNSDLTLPRTITQTLPFLANDKLLAILQRTGLASELDNRTSITFLAPDDTVLPDLPDAQLAQALRGHILLGSPAYTPLLVNGATYTTLAGTTVRVEVRGPDFFVGGTKILNGDAIVKNGVVHTVDRVRLTISLLFPFCSSWVYRMATNRRINLNSCSPLPPEPEPQRARRRRPEQDLPLRS